MRTGHLLPLKVAACLADQERVGLLNQGRNSASCRKLLSLLPLDLAPCLHAAPEVLRRDRGYDAKQADVWSSGVMLFAMLCCTYPFERPEDEKDPLGHNRVVQRIMKGAKQKFRLLFCHGYKLKCRRASSEDCGPGTGIPSGA